MLYPEKKSTPKDKLPNHQRTTSQKLDIQVKKEKIHKQSSMKVQTKPIGKQNLKLKKRRKQKKSFSKSSISSKQIEFSENQEIYKDQNDNDPINSIINAQECTLKQPEILDFDISKNSQNYRTSANSKLNYYQTLDHLYQSNYSGQIQNGMFTQLCKDSSGHLDYNLSYTMLLDSDRKKDKNRNHQFEDDQSQPIVKKNLKFSMIESSQDDNPYNTLHNTQNMRHHHLNIDDDTIEEQIIEIKANPVRKTAKNQRSAGFYTGQKQSQAATRSTSKKKLNLSKNHGETRQLNNNDINSLNDSKDSIIIIQECEAPFKTVRKEVSLHSLSKQHQSHQTFHKKKRSVDHKKNSSILNNNSVAHSRMFPSTTNIKDKNLVTSPTLAQNIIDQSRQTIKASKKYPSIHGYTNLNDNQNHLSIQKFTCYGTHNDMSSFQSRQRNLSTASLSKSKGALLTEKRKPSIFSKRESIKDEQHLKKKRSSKKILSQTMRIVLDSPRYRVLSPNNINDQKSMSNNNNNKSTTNQHTALINEYSYKDLATFNGLIGHQGTQDQDYKNEITFHFTNSQSKDLSGIKDRVQIIFRAYQARIMSLTQSVDELSQENKILKRKLFHQQSSKSNLAE
ncbi:UNKNOWN [Stylonychia lemnae]|uniref:Uncharacterized protein n=1 Tax=Stylonychia lemnae TaxID=5949 RepID=A0A078B6Q4_STYLE|nr:UNKNOWN [Stylonychia lemnae]|eukprot:CDW90059.1 UNKNOWN [Stylonychia lemnae]